MGRFKIDSPSTSVARKAQTKKLNDKAINIPRNPLHLFFSAIAKRHPGEPKALSTEDATEPEAAKPNVVNEKQMFAVATYCSNPEGPMPSPLCEALHRARGQPGWVLLLHLAQAVEKAEEGVRGWHEGKRMFKFNSPARPGVSDEIKDVKAKLTFCSTCVVLSDAHWYIGISLRSGHIAGSTTSKEFLDRCLPCHVYLLKSLPVNIFIDTFDDEAAWILALATAFSRSQL